MAGRHRRGDHRDRPGHYEIRDHPSLAGLVVIWWCPAAGVPGPTNMTLGAERVPLLAEALNAYLAGGPR